MGSERSIPRVREIPIPRALAAPALVSLGRRLDLVASHATPIRLAVGQLFVATLLTVASLAAPAPRPGFWGLANNTNGPRAYRRLATWNDGIGWLGTLRGRLDLDPMLYLWTVRGSFLLLALLQLVALFAALRQASGDGAPRAWRWLIGPALICLVLLAFPPFCADVFFYAMSGHVTEIGGNVYHRPLGWYYNDPLLQYNDWRTITAPYGPLWTTISRGIVSITGTDPVAAVLGFKIFATACAFGLVGVTYLLARRLTDDRRLRIGALVLAAWQPVLLFESATGSHNDAPMMLLALGGLLVLTTPRRGAIRIGLLLIAASVLIKYVTLPLLAFGALWRLRGVRPEASLRRVIGQWLLDLTAVGGLVAIVYAPYWIGLRTLDSVMAQQGRLLSSTLWLLPYTTIRSAFGSGVAGFFRDVLGAMTLLGIAFLLFVTFRRLGERMRDDNPEARPLAAQVTAWTVATVALAFLPVNTHSWYAIWATAPVALFWVVWNHGHPSSVATPSARATTGWTIPLSVPRWLVYYCAWVLLNMLVYHTRVLS